jgi:hypothetical protein
LDASLAQGLVNLFAEGGWNVYVDWADTAMTNQPTRETAKLIQNKIIESRYFLFLATPNSMSSRWCPWEFGYADGKKPADAIFIVPTTDRSGQWHGNEYLQLYRKIDFAPNGRLGVWEPGQDRGVLLETL